MATVGAKGLRCLLNDEINGWFLRSVGNRFQGMARQKPLKPRAYIVILTSVAVTVDESTSGARTW